MLHPHDASPWPTGPGSRRTTAALGVLVMIGVLTLAAGFGFRAIGHPAGLWYAAAFAATMFTGAFVGRSIRVRPWRRGSSLRTGAANGGRATHIDGSLSLFLALVLMFLLLGVTFTMAAIDYHGSADVPAAAIPSALCALAGLYFLAFPLLAFIGRVRRATIALSADGVHQRGWTFSAYLPWASIDHVVAVTEDGRPRLVIHGYANAHPTGEQYAPLWKVDRLASGTRLELDCDTFGAHPEFVHRVVRCYFDNPDLRRELGTDAVIARFRQTS